MFEDMFHEIESKRSELGVASYGASVTTMEEVFLRYVLQSNCFGIFYKTKYLIKILSPLKALSLSFKRKRPTKNVTYIKLFNSSKDMHHRTIVSMHKQDKHTSISTNKPPVKK